MAREFKENRLNPNILTPTQISIERTLLQSFGKVKSHGGRAVFILSGLSGVGKTEVLKHLHGLVDGDYGKVLLDDDVSMQIEDWYKQGYNGSIFASHTPNAIFDTNSVSEAAKKSGVPSLQFELPGMSKSETTAYLATFPKSADQRLSKDQIVEYSIGIPLLVQQLMIPGINEYVAARIAAKYLQSNVARAYDKGVRDALHGRLLQLRPNSNIAKALHELATFDYHLYDDIHIVLELMRKANERTGYVEESPLFVAIESEQAYEQILSTRTDHTHAMLEIFIPTMSYKDMERAKHAFGIEQGYVYEKPRLELFLANKRKLGIWYREDRFGDGITYFDEENYRQYIGKVAKWDENIQLGKLPFISPKFGSAMFIHVHDHHGGIINPVNVGWCTETMLQHRDIPYFVDNFMLGKRYWYNPLTKHIEIISDVVNY